jgi:hypothetical protein
MMALTGATSTAFLQFGKNKLKRRSSKCIKLKKCDIAKTIANRTFFLQNRPQYYFTHPRSSAKEIKEGIKQNKLKNIFLA